MDASYSKCRITGLAGTEAGKACEEFTDFCAASQGPFKIPGSLGDRTAATREECFSRAQAMAQSGARPTRKASAPLNGAYAACRRFMESARYTEAESCQQLTDLCLSTPSGPYVLETVRLSNPFSFRTQCVSAAASMVDAGLTPSPGSIARSEAARHTITSAALLSASVPAEGAALLAHLQKHPASAVPGYIARFGMQTMVDACKSAGDLAPQLLANLDAFEDLISTTDDFAKAARLILAFQKQLKSSCGFYSEEFTDLARIRRHISSLDDIERRGAELIAIVAPISQYDLLTYWEGGSASEDYAKLLPVIEKYGLTMVSSLFTAGGREILRHLQGAGNIAFIDSVGPQVFAAFVIGLGRRASSALSTLRCAEVAPLVARIGLAPFQEAAIETARKLGTMGDAVLLYGLPACADLIRNGDDLKRLASLLTDATARLPENDRRVFLQALYLFKGFIIRDPADPEARLKRAISRLQALSNESDGGMWTLMEHWKATMPRSLEELEADQLPAFERFVLAGVPSCAASPGSFACSVQDVRQQCLVRILLQRGHFLAALRAMHDYQAASQRLPQAFATLRLSAFTGLLLNACDATDPARIDLGRGVVMTQAQLRQELLFHADEMLQQHRDSAVANRASLLRNAIAQTSFAFKRTSRTELGIRFTTFQGIQNLTIAQTDNGPPVVIPGTVSASGNDIIVPRFDGRYQIRFRKPATTIPESTDALLEARLLLPAEFFTRLQHITFTGETHETLSGQYGTNSVEIFNSGSSLATIAHELAHHWDLGVTGDSDLPQDPSLLFYRLSWNRINRSRDIWGGQCTEEGLGRQGVRSDFKADDFIRWYGMCGRVEDIATVAEEYVTAGDKLRTRIREQLGRGQFILGAKYLFVRHLMPFLGREYGVSPQSPPLEVAEFELTYRTAPQAANAQIDAILRKIPRPAATSSNP